MSSHFDEDRPAMRKTHEIGEDLSNLSANELADRITLLEAEIDRLNAEKARKSAGRSAAESLFRK